MFKVVKRDGEVASFNIGKITNAIEKAFKATDKQFNTDIIELLGLRVTADFQNKIKDSLIDVESIQDSVETVLEQSGYSDVAKAYILYRKHREKIRNMKSTILDYKDIVNSYVKVEDWRVKENSTVTYSVGGLILSNSGAITANYWLSEIYDEEIADAHRNADLHLHDLSMLTGYCAGWSLKQLIREGLGGIEGKITSAPAKHLSVLCNQMVNFLGIMQNEWAGAQAFSSFDTYLAYLWFLFSKKLGDVKIGYCARCGKAFSLARRRGVPKKFCSEECKTAAKNDKTRQLQIDIRQAYAEGDGVSEIAAAFFPKQASGVACDKVRHMLATWVELKHDVDADIAQGSGDIVKRCVAEGVFDQKYVERRMKALKKVR